MFANVNSPCKGCERRCGPCHSTCEEYKSYQVQLEMAKKAKKDSVFVPTASFMKRRTRAIKKGRIKG